MNFLLSHSRTSSTQRKLPLVIFSGRAFLNKCSELRRSTSFTLWSVRVALELNNHIDEFKIYP